MSDRSSYRRLDESLHAAHEALLKWGREAGRSVAPNGWSRTSAIARGMEAARRGIDVAILYQRPDEMSDASVAIDRMVAPLNPKLRDVLHVYYRSDDGAPAEAHARRLRCSLSTYSARLRAGRMAIARGLDAQPMRVA